MIGDPYSRAPEPPPPPPPPARRSSALAIFLAGAIVGGAAGGGAAAVVGGMRGDNAAVPGSKQAPPTTPPALAAIAPAPSPGPPGTTAIEVVDVVQELSSSVVTVLTTARNSRRQASGSGFVVDAQRGYVITNHHVVEGGASYDVFFPDNRKVSARLIGSDPETDVAVLEVGAQSLKPLALGNSDQAPIGGTVIAIGSALGDFRNSVTVGVLSGKGRRLQSETDPNVFLEDLIQTDAAISPGNSGGPLILAASRQVIGMNTLVIRVAGSEGLGFAVSSNTVRQIADEIIKNGRVERGLIGVFPEPLTSRQAVSLGLPAGTTGVIVTNVAPGSSAAAAGMRTGDVITRVNEQQIDLEHPLQTIMLRYRPGDRVRLTVIRDGRELSMEITLGRRT